MNHIRFCWPKKNGTNWFMPALVNSRFGESGSSDEEGTIVCCFSRKKSRKDWRIWALVIMAGRGYRGSGWARYTKLCGGAAANGQHGERVCGPRSDGYCSAMA